MRGSFGLSLVVSLALLSGCKGDPSTPEYWQKSLKSGRRAAERIRTLEELRASKAVNASFLPMLHGQLAGEKQEEVKAELAKILGEVGDPSSVQPLTDAIDLGAGDADTNRMNREIAAALGRIRSPASVPPLLRMLKAKDAYVQLEAIRGLGELRAKEAVEPLIAIANDDGAEALVNRRAVQSLGEIGDPRAVPTLVKMMYKQHRSRGDTFYGDSSFALYQIGGPARDALLTVLKGEDRALSSWAKEHGIDDAALYAKAAQVLGDFQDRRAEPLLVQRMAYRAPDADMTVLLQMTVADALGRLRSQSGVTAIAALAKDERYPARERFVWALGRIGDRQALPSLQAAATTGVWDVRDRAIAGVTLVGDERELAFIEKLEKEEPTRTQRECDEYDFSGCDRPEELAKKHIAAIEQHAARLIAARDCKTDAACWAKKLEAKEAPVRERAALELGRAGATQHVDALVARVGDADLDARVAAIQALDWISESDTKGTEALARHRPAMLKQLDSEKGRTEFARVNEDLRRLAAKAQRAPPGT